MDPGDCAINGRPLIRTVGLVSCQQILGRSTKKHQVPYRNHYIPSGKQEYSFVLYYCITEVFSSSNYSDMSSAASTSSAMLDDTKRKVEDENKKYDHIICF